MCRRILTLGGPYGGLVSDQRTIDRVEAGLNRLLGCVPVDARVRHEERSRALVERARWEAPRNADLDDWQCWVVARIAAVLAVGFVDGADPFAAVRSVIIHPRSLRMPEWAPRTSGGVVRGGMRTLAGQSGHGRGPVMVSWSQVVSDLGRPEGGRNVVIHEFAHKFDQLDGAADGLPPIADQEMRDTVNRVMGRSLHRVRRRRQRLLRPYAGSNPAEHFAVATEVFFTRPGEMRRRSSQLYSALSSVYRQDPAWALGQANP